MRILIVDDEYEKVPDISEIARKISADAVVEHVTTASAGRIALNENYYDLLIVDLHLPPVVGAQGVESGGVDFLNLLQLDQRSKLPGQILFLTGHEDLQDKLGERVVSTGGELCFYSPHESKWSNVIAGRLNYINNIVKRKEYVIPNADVAIISALRAPELEAVIKLPYDFKAYRVNGDPIGYNFGSTTVDDRVINIVATSSYRKGMSSAASLSSKVVSVFKPKILIMTGICAGIKGKVNLGDVIVGDLIWDWGSGKSMTDADGASLFKIAPHQCATNVYLLEIAKDLASDMALLSQIRAGWYGPVPGGVFKVHVGPLASGGAVIADDQLTARIIDQNKDLLGIDMEAYAVMAAAEYASLPPPKPVVIKSVCDFANSDKNDNWQAYAAYTSAAFADALIKTAIRSGQI